MMMETVMLKWIRHTYEVAQYLDTAQKVEDLVSAIADDTGEEREMIRQEIWSIIRDVKAPRRPLART